MHSFIIASYHCRRPFVLVPKYRLLRSSAVRLRKAHKIGEDFVISKFEEHKKKQRKEKKRKTGAGQTSAVVNYEHRSQREVLLKCRVAFC